VAAGVQWGKATAWRDVPSSPRRSLRSPV